MGNAARRPRKGLGWARVALACALALVGACLAAPAQASAVTYTYVTDDQSSSDAEHTYSFEFTGVTVEQGFEIVSDVSQYYNTTTIGGDLVDEGDDGFAFFYDGDGAGTAALRYTGGSYEGTDIDAIVTITDCGYREPDSGDFSTLEGYVEYFETFQAGVYVNDLFRRDADDPYTTLNFYTVGMTQISVQVEFVAAGTDEPVAVSGHMTCEDLDVNQSFSFGGAVTQVAVHQQSVESLVYDADGDGVADTAHLSIDADADTVTSSGLSIEDADDENYLLGLVQVDFDTTEETPVELTFGATWDGSQGSGGVQSFFAMTPEYVTYADSGDIPLTKDVSATEAQVGDTLTYTLDVQVHEEGVTCRSGLRYTELAVSDVLDECLEYVEGSACLTDESGAVIDDAGEATYDEDARTLTFTFSEDYLADLVPAGQHYLLAFDVVISAMPDDGEVANTGTLAWALSGGEARTVESNEVTTTVTQVEEEEATEDEEASPALSIDKSVDESTAAAGDVVEFTIVVTQTVEGATATNVSVVDELPEGLSVTGTPELSGVDGTVSYDDGAVTVEIAELAYGSEATIVFCALVDDDAAGQTLTNTAQASADDADEVDDDATVEVEEAASSEKGDSGSSSYADTGDATTGLRRAGAALAGVGVLAAALGARQLRRGRRRYAKGR